MPSYCDRGLNFKRKMVFQQDPPNVCFHANRWEGRSISWTPFDGLVQGFIKSMPLTHSAPPETRSFGLLSGAGSHGLGAPPPCFRLVRGVVALDGSSWFAGIRQGLNKFKHIAPMLL